MLGLFFCLFYIRVAIIHAFNSYEKETEFYDEAVRNAKREQLESDALNVRLPATSKGFLSFLVPCL